MRRTQCPNNAAIDCNCADLGHVCFELRMRQDQETAVEAHERLDPKLLHTEGDPAYRERDAQMRQFDTGATRNVDDDNHDYEGFLSPLVIKRFGEYMHAHRKQADGNIRDSDNWQKGIPLASYMKSGWRHFFDWWCGHREVESRDDLETALCALLFNVQGYLHELLKARPANLSEDS